MRINKLDLLSKGWSVKEIEHASKIIARAEDKKHKTIRLIDNSVYWALLVIIVVASIVCSIFLTPFLFAVKNYFVLIMTSIVGLIFGVMFSIIIVDIEKIDTRHNKNLLSTFVLCGMINFCLIILFANSFMINTRLTMSYNIFLIAGIYLFSYLVPHITYIIRNKKI